MKRPPSAVAAIGGFGIGVALLSIAATASIVLIAPEPDGPRFSMQDAAKALRGDAPGFDRRIGTEPEGRRALLFEVVLATQTGRATRDVRVVMTGPAVDPLRVFPLSTHERVTERGPRPDLVARLREADGTPPAPIVIRERWTVNSDDPRQVAPAYLPPSPIRVALASAQVAPFVAGVRQPDGQWLTVSPSQPLLSGWRLRVLAAILVSLLLIVPLAWLFARRLTRPFRALAQAVDTSGATIPIEGPRELREAAAAIAAMRARISEEAAERTRILTAIAHDLRTPLTSLRLRIESVAEPQRARMAADVDRMQAMIGEVLDFARDADAPPHPLAVRPLLEEIVADMDAGRGIVTLAHGEEAWIDAAAPAFRRVVENLVRNAIDYAGGGRVALHAHDGNVVIAVIDAGPGIAADDRDRLLLPFERGDASRNRDTGGAGLGLSIVRDFAARHRGDFTLRDGHGGGTIAELRLPTTASLG